MLRHDVVEAARAGRFHIYPVETIDEAVELLTGVDAGVADERGMYPEQTVNRRVADRLADLFEIRKHLSGEARGASGNEGSS